MGHPVPKDLKGEERVFSITAIDLHFSKRGIVYNGIACVISGLTLYIFNFYAFATLFILLNVIAYPLAHASLPSKNFEGGNVKFDKYIYRIFKYRKGKNIYLRGRGK